LSERSYTLVTTVVGTDFTGITMQSSVSGFTLHTDPVYQRVRPVLARNVYDTPFVEFQQMDLLDQRDQLGQSDHQPDRLRAQHHLPHQLNLTNTSVASLARLTSSSFLTSTKLCPSTEESVDVSSCSSLESSCLCERSSRECFCQTTLMNVYTLDELKDVEEEEDNDINNMTEQDINEVLSLALDVSSIQLDYTLTHLSQPKQLNSVDKHHNENRPTLFGSRHQQHRQVSNNPATLPLLISLRLLQASLIAPPTTIPMSSIPIAKLAHSHGEDDSVTLTDSLEVSSLQPPSTTPRVIVPSLGLLRRTASKVAKLLAKSMKVNRRRQLYSCKKHYDVLQTGANEGLNLCTRMETYSKISS